MTAGSPPWTCPLLIRTTLLHGLIPALWAAAGGADYNILTPNFYHHGNRLERVIFVAKAKKIPNSFILIMILSIYGEIFRSRGHLEAFFRAF